MFLTFDQDNSGTIEIPELITAMKSFGFNISEQMLKKLVRKYEISHNKLTSNDLEHTVSFDNFVQLCVSVKTLTDVFRTLDQTGTGWAKMNYEQFMEVIL